MTWGANPMPSGMPEPWAVEWGSDRRFGVFMGFGVGGVVQRLRWVPPGRFVMGSPEGEAGHDTDEAQHEVELRHGFWLADTPVTQALWEAVMGNNPSQFKGRERPVEHVSWDGCQEFLAKLDEQVPGLDARLPTEAEWEYACRAGTETATWVGDLEIQGIKAPQLDGIAWYYGNSRGGTQPVRGKPPNPWGFYDMLGNVYEWCEDWFGPYAATPVTEPRGPRMGSLRVSRGGSWHSDAGRVRAAYRYTRDPSYRHSNLGFRLARGQPNPDPGARWAAPG